MGYKKQTNSNDPGNSKSTRPFHYLWALLNLTKAARFGVPDALPAHSWQGMSFFRLYTSNRERPSGLVAAFRAEDVCDRRRLGGHGLYQAELQRQFFHSK